MVAKNYHKKGGNGKKPVTLRFQEITKRIAEEIRGWLLFVLRVSKKRDRIINRNLVKVDTKTKAERKISSFRERDENVKDMTNLAEKERKVDMTG